TPDGSAEPDRAGLALCALACALIAAILGATPSPPSWMLRLLCPGGTVTTTVVISAADPVTVAPTFYVLPLAMAAYFFPGREVAANVALVAAAYALALDLWIDSTNPAQEFLTVLGAGGITSVAIFRLRRQVHALVAELQTMATRDALTGALNRGAFEQRLEDELARTRRSGGACAVAMLDIDHFKAINDGCGHEAGDEALRRLARIVESSKRSADVFGRIGGDEFALILVDTDAAGTDTFAEHLRARLGARDGGDAETVTVSIGIADAPFPGTTARDVLRVADRGLYAAKAAGRDRVARAAVSSPR
ncbi:MAG: hypothetical protein QOC64_2448, partial [Solirubrobacteraceae bacterium]|nr:hypothetical protein [Solirubrobacteraceae bacterium]